MDCKSKNNPDWLCYISGNVVLSEHWAKKSTTKAGWMETFCWLQLMRETGCSGCQAQEHVPERPFIHRYLLCIFQFTMAQWEFSVNISALNLALFVSFNKKINRVTISFNTFQVRAYILEIWSDEIQWEWFFEFSIKTCQKITHYIFSLENITSHFNLLSHSWTVQALIVKIAAVVNFDIRRSVFVFLCECVSHIYIYIYIYI